MLSRNLSDLKRILGETGGLMTMALPFRQKAMVKTYFVLMGVAWLGFRSVTVYGLIRTILNLYNMKELAKSPTSEVYIFPQSVLNWSLTKRDDNNWVNDPNLPSRSSFYNSKNLFQQAIHCECRYIYFLGDPGEARGFSTNTGKIQS